MNFLDNIGVLSAEEFNSLTSRILMEQNVRTQKVLERMADEFEKTKHDLEITKHRVDNLDLTNIEGTERQRLSAMIKKYALDNGVTFSIAWKHFASNFDTAYRRNVGLLKANYAKRIKKEKNKVSLPETLEALELLPDAIRVADKMLNG